VPLRPRFDRLEGWLDWQLRLHPATIELGLDRVTRVLARTGWRRPDVPVLTVGGTNGKGSCVALLDAMLRADGRRVATFTSPHLVDYRERIRIDGAMIDEAALIAAFERIADALGDDTLTFFEFNALAALLAFEQARPDAIVLEVGLGGRLDAVNVVDADVAVVVSVGLDHMEYLGPDVEAIGREKAGIFRRGRPAVYGDTDPPASVREVAAAVGARLRVRGADFDARVSGAGTWDFLREGAVRHAALPLPALRGAAQVANAATALATLEALDAEFVPARAALEAGLRTVRLNGRYQRIDDPRGFHWILDVAHNPAAAATLAENLVADVHRGRTLAVCGMLGDKDVTGVLVALRNVVDVWFACSAEGPRALAADEVARRARDAGIAMQPAGAVPQALGRAASQARAGDRVVVFGSFHTVGPALAALGVPL
jgi:dihydrofolate synthase / folylpolyglutamate synthase